MKTSTKILHTLVSFLGLEEIIIKKAKTNSFYTKLIPLNSFYSKGTYKTVIRNNSRFKLELSDYMQWYVWADLDDLSWRSVPKKQGSVLDIGANVGAFTIQLLNNNSDVKVHAFEPNPFVFEHLSQNMSLNKIKDSRYSLINKGLAEQKATLNFYWNSNNSGGGSIRKDKKNTLQTEIEVLTIDDYVLENNIHDVIFIKIDVEGYEPQVIKGAKETITKQQPILFIEVSPKWWNKNGYSTKDVLSIFKTLQYSFFLVINEKELKPITFEKLILIKDSFNLFISK